MISCSDFKQEWKLCATFYGTRAEAEEVKRAMETVAAVYFTPTDDNARALFTLGAEAIVAVAQNAGAD